MKKLIGIIALIALLTVAACSNDKADGNTEVDSNEEEGKGTITFGQTGWSSTEAPTQIAKLILEEAGYDVEISLLDQPVIFEGLKEKEVDFFMDAWLPYTEEALWAEYEEDLIKVAESYTDAPLGWVVPTYVEEDSIEDIKKNPEKFEGTVYTIDAGAGIVKISEQVLEDYDLDMYELAYSSEGAMLGELDARINKKEPVIITGWRPHSMFTQYDLKFLEEPNENFKFDNIYVISYKGIEETYPEAYEILSKWSIEVDDLEQMMYEYEVNGIPFEDLAEEWIEENRDQVDEMLGK
ncbi:glycine betaine ABC transporter substrate-binding protein [Pseudogracilibacillus sp. SE30717A]|uniref:glycine betaine ABC transporter substrate-binding protein n=1 Tax=Pseudogracilibacillus sp. SE30717A TaxID=3098293 RepID=UPI00300E51F9